MISIRQPEGLCIKSGVYGVERGGGFIMAVIRLGLRSRYGHAWVFVGHKVVAAQPGGVRFDDLPAPEEMALADELLDYLEGLRPGIGQQIANQAIWLGDGHGKYGFLDIAALGLRQFGINLGFINRRITRSDRMICSQLVDEVYKRAGVHLFTDGRLSQDVTPGDLADLITVHDWSSIKVDEERDHARR
jgi:hypothetical protein